MWGVIQNYRITNTGLKSLFMDELEIKQSYFLWKKIVRPLQLKLKPQRFGIQDAFEFHSR